MPSDDEGNKAVRKSRSNSRESDRSTSSERSKKASSPRISPSQYSDDTFISTTKDSKKQKNYGRLGKKHPYNQPLGGRSVNRRPGPYSKEKTMPKPMPTKHSTLASIKSPRGGSMSTLGGASVMDGDSKTVQRVLSANRSKINELRNKVAELSAQVLTLQEKNRELHRDEVKSERLLKRFEEKETDMPVILHQQQEETTALREQLRRLRVHYDKQERAVRQTQEELERTQRLLRKMKALVDDKNLREREDLSQRLAAAETSLAEKTERVAKLEQHVAILTKNHKHEFGIERARHKDVQNNIVYLQQELGNLRVQLREKEKECEMRNIYALRGLRPPHHINDSLRSSPVFETSFSSANSQKPPRPKPTTSSDRRYRTDQDQGLLTTSSSKEQKRQKEPGVDFPRGGEADERKLQQARDVDATPKPGDDDEEWENLEEDSRRLERELQEKAEHDERELERMKEEQRKKEEAEKARRKKEEAEDERRREEVERQREAAERERKEREEADRILNSEEEKVRIHQKNILLARLREIDEEKHKETTVRSSLGAGAVDDGFSVNSTAQRMQAVDAEGLPSFGDYKPTFLATGSTKQKPPLVRSSAQQFGDGIAERSTVDTDAPLFTKGQGDSYKIGDRNNSGLSSANTGNKRGAGSSDSRKRLGLLPQRAQQPVSTFNTVAVDDVDDDDDVEELIL